jgi:hypothetical protein
VDAQQIQAAIKVLALAKRTQAEETYKAAGETMAAAMKYAEQHAGQAMSERRTHIRNEGARKAAELELQAQRHERAARTAEKGYFLMTDDDAKDANFTREHQSLIFEAGRHGLIRTSEPK